MCSDQFNSTGIAFDVNIASSSVALKHFSLICLIIICGIYNHALGGHWNVSKCNNICLWLS